MMSPAIQELCFLAKEWKKASSELAAQAPLYDYTLLLAARTRFLATYARLRPEELAEALVLLDALVEEETADAS